MKRNTERKVGWLSCRFIGYHQAMSRPPQNLNLIDYAMAEAERVFIGARFLLRERLQESRRRKVAQFIALTKIIPFRTNKLHQIRLLGKWRR